MADLMMTGFPVFSFEEKLSIAILTAIRRQERLTAHVCRDQKKRITMPWIQRTRTRRPVSTHGMRRG